MLDLVSVCGFMLDSLAVFVLTYRVLDIEYEMTLFAFYYVGIGLAVFILGYLQVCLCHVLYVQIYKQREHDNN